MTNGQKKRHVVTLLRGDGIGPEVVEAARRCIEATGAAIEWREALVGAEAIRKHQTPLPEETLQAIQATGVALKGPVTTPIGSGFRSVNVAIRQALDLYACLRPCQSLAGVRAPYRDVDLVIVRENTEDLYAGIEFPARSREAGELVRLIERLQPKKLPPEAAISIKPISARGSERIARCAFEYALAHHRKKVTAVTKANIMKCTDGLFLETARQVAQQYAGRVAFEERLVDNLCMQLVLRPQEYDILVLPNLYGDIVSDLCAGLVGGLGVAPGANIGSRVAVFEAVHGSAPKYAGQNKVNPTAMILSGVLMLHHLGEAEAAERLSAAVRAVLAEGASVTYDLKPRRDDPSAVGTSQMADAITEHVRAGAHARSR